MNWIAPTEKDTAAATLKKRLWHAADQFRANSGLKIRGANGRFDFALFNPRLRDCNCFFREHSMHWQIGVPYKGNANFARMHHYIHHPVYHGTL